MEPLRSKGPGRVGRGYPPTRLGEESPGGGATTGGPAPTGHLGEEKQPRHRRAQSRPVGVSQATEQSHLIRPPDVAVGFPLWTHDTQRMPASLGAMG